MELVAWEVTKAPPKNQRPGKRNDKRPGEAESRRNGFWSRLRRQFGKIKSPGSVPAGRATAEPKVQHKRVADNHNLDEPGAKQRQPETRIIRMISRQCDNPLFSVRSESADSSEAVTIVAAAMVAPRPGFEELDSDGDVELGEFNRGQKVRVIVFHDLT